MTEDDRKYAERCQQLIISMCELDDEWQRCPFIPAIAQMAEEACLRYDKSLDDLFDTIRIAIDSNRQFNAEKRRSQFHIVE